LVARTLSVEVGSPDRSYDQPSRVRETDSRRRHKPPDPVSTKRGQAPPSRSYVVCCARRTRNKCCVRHTMNMAVGSPV
jgi:hypothetical protein